MKEKISKRERMMLAMRRQQPDRVPVSPDISNMIPCRMTGKPFWDIYAHNNPPLWKAHMAACRYFDMETWGMFGSLNLKWENPVPVDWKVEKLADSVRIRTTYHTSRGDLHASSICPPNQPPWPEERPIKNIEEQLLLLRELLPMPVGVQDDDFYRMYIREMNENGIVNLGIAPPGIQTWEHFIEGGAQAAIYAAMEYPELFEELREYDHRRAIKLTEIFLDYKPDAYMFGASGLLTLQGINYFRQFSLPTIQAVTKMCREAGVLSMLHACGKARQLVETFANETDLDCINPIEDYLTGGDIVLADIKKEFGHKICLMGNLNTTELMARGSVEEVRAATRKAIDDAAAGGGFILSTGDQVAGDAPYENIFAMIDEARKYGVYS